MGLLKWLRGESPEGAHPPYLFDAPHWSVVGVDDLARFFQALPLLESPSTMVGLAGGWWPDPVRSDLGMSSTNVDDVVRLALPSEFHSALFVPVTADSAAMLVHLAETRAEPEVATHLVVVRDGASLLEWFDLPGDPITIAPSISDAEVQRFADAIGGKIEA
jgi:hypothetical protein